MLSKCSTHFFKSPEEFSTIYSRLMQLESNPTFLELCGLQQEHIHIDEFIANLDLHLPQLLKITPEALLSYPVASIEKPSIEHLQKNLRPEDFVLVDNLVEVLTNNLASLYYDSPRSSTAYDTVATDAGGFSESVTEAQHGLQFATQLWHLGANCELVLSGLFHDIARLIMPSDQANKYHHIEGEKFLTSIFGQNVGFVALYHTLGKYILAKSWPYYFHNVLSTVSRETLVTQEEHAKEMLEDIKQNYPDLISRKSIFLFIVLMRCFDETSKNTGDVKLLSRLDVNHLIKSCLYNQINTYIEDNKSITSIIAILNSNKLSILDYLERAQVLQPPELLSVKR